MKVRTSTDAGSIRSEDWTDPSGLGIGGATSETNVIYVRTWGNDTTGDGSLATPYATANKAYTVWTAGKVLDFGIGNFGNGTFANAGATLYLRGMHNRKTILGTITTLGNATTIIGDGNVTIEEINGSGTDGSSGSAGSDGADGVSVGEAGSDGGSGSNGGSGNSAGELILVRIRVSGNVTCNGGNGGSGGTGGAGGDGGPGDGGTTSGNGGNGGTGGDAGYGGAGGHCSIYDSFILGSFSASSGSPGGYGSGGAPGSPGIDGGAGTGSPGSSGYDGSSGSGSSDGYLDAYRSHVNSISVTLNTYSNWTYYDGPA